jgi:hypothetical protein
MPKNIKNNSTQKKKLSEYPHLIPIKHSSTGGTPGFHQFIPHVLVKLYHSHIPNPKKSFMVHQFFIPSFFVGSPRWWWTLKRRWGPTLPRCRVAGGITDPITWVGDVLQQLRLRMRQPWMRHAMDAPCRKRLWFYHGFDLSLMGSLGWYTASKEMEFAKDMSMVVRDSWGKSYSIYSRMTIQIEWAYFVIIAWWLFGNYYHQWINLVRKSTRNH